MLLARLFESLPLVWSCCGANIRIAAFITQSTPVARILNHIGEPAEPPRISPARGPPAWDDPTIEAVPDWDALAQPQPDYVWEPKVQWWPPPITRSLRRRASPCTRLVVPPASRARSRSKPARRRYPSR